VSELGQGQHFGAEAPHGVGGAQQVGAQDPEGHPPLEDGVVGLVDVAQAAGADQALDPIALRDQPADQLSRRSLCPRRRPQVYPADLQVA
jgi:hypothetical protein